MSAKNQPFPPSRESYPAARTIQGGEKNDLPFDTAISDIRYFLTVYEQTGDTNALQAAHSLLGGLLGYPENY